MTPVEEVLEAIASNSCQDNQECKEKTMTELLQNRDDTLKPMKKDDRKLVSVQQGDDTLKRDDTPGAMREKDRKLKPVQHGGGVPMETNYQSGGTQRPAKTKSRRKIFTRGLRRGRRTKPRGASGNNRLVKMWRRAVRRSPPIQKQ